MSKFIDSEASCSDDRKRKAHVVDGSFNLAGVQSLSREPSPWETNELKPIYFAIDKITKTRGSTVAYHQSMLEMGSSTVYISCYIVAIH